MAYTILYVNRMVWWLLGYPTGHHNCPMLLGPRFEPGSGKIFVTSRWAPKVAFWLRFKTGQLLEQ